MIKPHLEYQDMESRGLRDVQCKIDLQAMQESKHVRTEKVDF